MGAIAGSQAGGSPTRARTWDLRINSPRGAYVISLHHQLLTASAQPRHRSRMQCNARACKTTLAHFWAHLAYDQSEVSVGVARGPSLSRIGVSHHKGLPDREASVGQSSGWCVTPTATFWFVVPHKPTPMERQLQPQHGRRPLSRIKTRADRKAQHRRGMSTPSIDFKAIHDQFRPRVLRYVARLVGEAEGEDVTQSVMLKVKEGLSRFRGDSNISTWIYRIATNVALDKLRQQRIQPLTDTGTPLRLRACIPSEMRGSRIAFCPRRQGLPRRWTRARGCGPLP